MSGWKIIRKRIPVVLLSSLVGIILPKLILVVLFVAFVCLAGISMFAYKQGQIDMGKDIVNIQAETYKSAIDRVMDSVDKQTESQERIAMAQIAAQRGVDSPPVSPPNTLNLPEITDNIVKGVISGDALIQMNEITQDRVLPHTKEQVLDKGVDTVSKIIPLFKDDTDKKE